MIMAIWSDCNDLNSKVKDMEVANFPEAKSIHSVWKIWVNSLGLMQFNDIPTFKNM